MKFGRMIGIAAVMMLAAGTMVAQEKTATKDEDVKLGYVSPKPQQILTRFFELDEAQMEKFQAVNREYNMELQEESRKLEMKLNEQVYAQGGGRVEWRQERGVPEDRQDGGGL